MKYRICVKRSVLQGDTFGNSRWDLGIPAAGWLCGLSTRPRAGYREWNSSIPEGMSHEIRCSIGLIYICPPVRPPLWGRWPARYRRRAPLPQRKAVMMTPQDHRAEDERDQPAPGRFPRGRGRRTAGESRKAAVPPTLAYRSPCMPFPLASSLRWGFFMPGEKPMHNSIKTCGSCAHWAGNTSLMGGPCDLHGGIRYAGMRCDEYESRSSLAEKCVFTWIMMIFLSCTIGTAYFFWFLFHRAGYF